MIMDAQNRPSNQQAITVAGTTVSTDSINLLVAHANPGRSGGGLRVVALVSGTLVGGTNIKAELIQSANSDLSSPDVIGTGLVVTTAAAVAGTVLLDVALPPTTKRYLGLQYTSTGIHSSGTVTAGVVGGSNATVGNIPMQTGIGGNS